MEEISDNDFNKKAHILPKFKCFGGMKMFTSLESAFSFQLCFFCLFPLLCQFAVNRPRPCQLELHSDMMDTT